MTSENEVEAQAAAHADLQREHTDLLTKNKAQKTENKRLREQLGALQHAQEDFERGHERVLSLETQVASLLEVCG